MSGRLCLIIFTAIWVASSIANGQQSALGTKSLAASQRQPVASRPVRPLTSVAVRAANTGSGKRSVGQPHSVLQVSYKDPVSKHSVAINTEPEAGDDVGVATETEPYFDGTSEASETENANAAAEPTNQDLLIGFATWATILLCLSVLTVLGIRRWQRSRGILPASNSNSRVLETVSLGPSRSVSLVQLGDVRAVVGCDGTGVSSIVLAQPSFEGALTDSDLNDSGNDPVEYAA